MNAFLGWLGQTTLVTAAMVPLVLWAGRGFRDRPAVQHALWAVVLLKFVAPPLVFWPWTMDQVRNVLWRPTPAASAPIAGGSPSDPLAVEQGFAEAGAGRSLPRLQPAESLDAAPALVEPLHSVSIYPAFSMLAFPMLSAVWALGAILCALLQLRRVFRHASFVRRGREPPKPLTAEIDAVALRMGVKSPRVVLARGILSPFLWCWGRLRLVWPEAMASEDEVARSRGVIAHELAHLRRRDHWVAWLELVAGVVWWWNPLFWFVRRRLRETAEMACDALAIALSAESRRDYAEMLLELSAGIPRGAPAHVLAVAAGSPSSFERRFSMVLSDRVSGKLSSLGILAAIGVAVVALPAWSPGQDDGKPRAISPADDAAVRDMIEQGKFAEAKERLESLRTPRGADKHERWKDLLFPETWNDILAKELPAACLKDLPKGANLSWKACTTCHRGPSETTTGQRHEKWKDILFPEKWREILSKELPAACLTELPINENLTWKACTNCHAGSSKPMPVEPHRLDVFKSREEVPTTPLPLAPPARPAPGVRPEPGSPPSPQFGQAPQSVPLPAPTDIGQDFAFPLAAFRAGPGIAGSPPSMTGQAGRAPSLARENADVGDKSGAGLVDLAERSLKATTQVKLARIRLHAVRGEELSGRADLQKRAEAEIALEEAEKREALLAGYWKNSALAAEAALASAEIEVVRATEQRKTGAISQAEAALAQSRRNEVKAYLQLLKSMASTVTDSTKTSAP